MPRCGVGRPKASAWTAPGCAAGVQRDLESWLAGIVVPKSFEWTTWGHHLPTDLASQQITADLLVSSRQQLAPA